MTPTRFIHKGVLSAENIRRTGISVALSSQKPEEEDSRSQDGDDEDEEDDGDEEEEKPKRREVKLRSLSPFPCVIPPTPTRRRQSHMILDDTSDPDAFRGFRSTRKRLGPAVQVDSPESSSDSGNKEQENVQKLEQEQENAGVDDVVEKADAKQEQEEQEHDARKEQEIADVNKEQEHDAGKEQEIADVNEEQDHHAEKEADSEQEPENAEDEDDEEEQQETGSSAEQVNVLPLPLSPFPSPPPSTKGRKQPIIMDDDSDPDAFGNFIRRRRERPMNPRFTNAVPTVRKRSLTAAEQLAIETGPSGFISRSKLPVQDKIQTWIPGRPESLNISESEPGPLVWGEESNKDEEEEAGVHSDGSD
ncbi:hypothetical protein BT96DRAFT_434497 [Gymnopus androsaceus JB14]|uniref:Uncharacterized protein n=1 Tax=Gymnopus androsaceus JB14 TaxID=1447944 RepID=A0A6A4I660_9AGAR|nr:hypothetical protein BT96DRAFT_434497 [Gymnopus androsaceus JB14]